MTSVQSLQQPPIAAFVSPDVHVSIVKCTMNHVWIYVDGHVTDCLIDGITPASSILLEEQVI